MTFFESVRSGFIRWLDFSGRSPRSEYWYFSALMPFLFTVTLGLGLGMASVFMEKVLGYTWGKVGESVSLALYVPFGIACTSVAVRRLHDTDRSGWWMLLVFLPLLVPVALLVAAPLIGPIIAKMIHSVWAWGALAVIAIIGQITLFIFYVTKGTFGKNRFGEDPLREDIVVRHHFSWMKKFSFLHCMILAFLLGTAFEARTWFIQDHPRPVMESVTRFFVIPASEKVTSDTKVLPHAIQMAARRGDNAQVLRALESGMSLDARNNVDQRHLLHYAARYGNIPLVKILLSKGVDINIPDADNSTPLHYAAYTPRNVGMVKFLLSKGAKWNIVDKEGYTPLGYAKMTGDKALIAVLTAAEDGK